MKFERAKAENCFSDSETYEYRLPISAGEFAEDLQVRFSVRINDRLKRPFLFAEATDGTKLRALLAERVIRVSFPNGKEDSIASFEEWLGGL